MPILNFNKLICLLLLLAVLQTSRLSAQVNPVDISLQFGFPDISLKAVAMDSVQVTYLATNHGLYAYNGNALQVINVEGLKPEGISAILLLGDTLWIGHISGEISLISIKSAKLVKQLFLTDQPIQKLIHVPAGNVAVATAGAGILLVSKGKTTNQLIDELTDSYVNDMAFNQNRNVLALATDRGVDILKFDLTSRSVSKQKQIVLENDLYRGVSWDGDTLLVSGDNTSLNRFSIEGQNLFKPTDNFRLSSKIYSGFGEHWLLDQQLGLCNIETSDSSANECFELPPGQEIVAVFPLREGFLIGWLSNGNYRLFPVNYKIYNQLGDAQLNGISAILAAPDHSIWVAVKNGFYQLDNEFGKNISIKRFISMSQNVLFPVIRIALWNNKLLAGSLGDGLYVIDLENNAQVIHFTESNGLDNNSVLDLVIDGDFVWVSTLTGIQQLNLNTLSNFKTLNGAPGYVYDLIVPSPNKLYASSQGESVFKENDGNLESISTTQLRDVSIVSMITSDDGQVWGLSVDSELYEIRDNKLEAWTQNASISSLGIYEILPVKSAKPALISANALYLSNHKSIFYEAFWLPGIFDSEYQHIAVTDTSGNFWIASKNGLVRLDKRIVQTSNQPFVSLQAVFANHISASKEPNFIYNPNETDISLVISAPWYDPFRPIIHEYRLLGLDTIWRATNNLELFFPKLAPGKYTLEVRSKFVNSGAVTDSFEHSFSIALPFYNRTWFYLLVGFVSLLIIVLWVRYREQKNTQQLRAETERIQGQFEVLKNQINPHFLFNSFNTLAAMIGSDPVKAEEYTEKLSAFFRQILSVQQNDVVSLQRELELAADFIYLQRSRFGDSLQYEVDVPQEYYNHKLPVLALQILLENAVKHNNISKAKPLTITITAKNNRLEISNNMQSRPSLPVSTGVGLTNLSNRMRILFDKELLVEKTNDTFKVIIPL